MVSADDHGRETGLNACGCYAPSRLIRTRKVCDETGLRRNIGEIACDVVLDIYI
jgi:hypothetical protein